MAVSRNYSTEKRLTHHHVERKPLRAEGDPKKVDLILRAFVIDDHQGERR